MGDSKFNCMDNKPNVNIQTTADLLNWLSVNNHELLARCLNRLSQIEIPLSRIKVADLEGIGYTKKEIATVKNFLQRSLIVFQFV